MLTDNQMIGFTILATIIVFMLLFTLVDKYLKKHDNDLKHSH